MKKNTLNNFSNMSDEIINLLEAINDKNCSYKLIKKKKLSIFSKGTMDWYFLLYFKKY